MNTVTNKAHAVLGGVGLLVAGVGCLLGVFLYDYRAHVSDQVAATEAAIRADIALLNAAASPTRDINQEPDRRLINEGRIQLALAVMQETIREVVEENGGQIASMSGGDQVAKPWGAIIQLTARFDAPHTEIVDILARLEDGEPVIRAEKATLNRRRSPSADDTTVTGVTAEVVFAAFTTARLVER